MAKRISEMDVVRALATVAVVNIHISATPLIATLKDGATTFIYLFLNVAARFAVPTFIMLSGMGLAISKRKEGYFSFLKRRVKKVVLPYILWSVIYTFTWDENTGGMSLSMPTVSRLLHNLITGDACYHVYFVIIIVQLYLLFPLIRNWLSSNTGLIISGIITVSMISIGQYAEIPDRWVFFFDIRNPLNWIFYFGVGIRLVRGRGIEILRSRKYKDLLSFVTLGMLGGMMLFVYRVGLRTGIDAALDALGPVIIFYTMLVNMWFWKLNWDKLPFRRSLDAISEWSYLIYLAHPFILMLYMNLLNKMQIEHYGLIFGITAVMLVTAGSVVFVSVNRLINCAFTRNCKQSA
ncbi:MAG: acyltransferase [Armatimonadota bacterium]